MSLFMHLVSNGEEQADRNGARLNGSPASLYFSCEMGSTSEKKQQKVSVCTKKQLYFHFKLNKSFKTLLRFTLWIVFFYQLLKEIAVSLVANCSAIFCLSVSAGSEGELHSLMIILCGFYQKHLTQSFDPLFLQTYGLYFNNCTATIWVM